jgi:hypothetical protein
MPTTVDERDGVPAQVEEYARKGYTVYREWATPAETSAATIQALTTAMTKPKGVLVSGTSSPHQLVVGLLRRSKGASLVFSQETLTTAHTRHATTITNTATTVTTTAPFASTNNHIMHNNAQGAH